MRNLVLLFLGIFGLMSFTHAQAATAAPSIALKPQEVIAGIKENQLYVMINLFSYKETLAKTAAPELSQLLVSLAQDQVKTNLTKDRFRSLKTAKVEFVFLKSSNEYGRIDFSKMEKHGYLLIRKDPASQTPAVTENRIELSSFKG